MPSTISRLKNTDSLGQWADKINALIGSLESFLATGGTFTSSASVTSSDLLVYDAGWKNKTLIGEIVIDTTFSSASQFKYKIEPTAISNRTAITSVEANADYLLIWDATDSALKKVNPQYIASPGGSAGQVQFNQGGTTFMGATGFTFNGTRLSVPTLSVNTNTIYVDEVNGRVGIGNSTPAYTLDVTGNTNTSVAYLIGGTSVLSATTLGSGVVNSSLTSLGTITTLNAGTGTFSGSISGLSLTVSNAVSTATLSTSGNVGVGGTFGATGAVTFGSTLAVTGNTTVGGTFGATGAATFSSSVAVTGVLTGRRNIIGITTGATAVAQTNYVIGATGLTVTLPASPTNGDVIGFIPANSSIINYTIARNGRYIMNVDENLTINVCTPFNLAYVATTGATGWVLS